jgi:hypothetical protein
MAHSQKQCIQVYNGANGSSFKVSNKANHKFPNEVYWVFQDPKAPIQKISVDKSIFLNVTDGTVLTTTNGETDVLTVDPQINPGAKQGIWSVPDKGAHILFPAGGIIIEN